jgi:hypothetical protein
MGFGVTRPNCLRGRSDAPGNRSRKEDNEGREVGKGRARGEVSSLPSVLSLPFYCSPSPRTPGQHTQPMHICTFSSQPSGRPTGIDLPG